MATKPPATKDPKATGTGRQEDKDSDEEGNLSSFQSHAAEGDILAKQGDYRKAIEAYTKALTLKPTEKNGLVARSKCFLLLGDSRAALADADEALKEDPEFFKGVYQKAEALYAQGDFEMSLVYYHRGNKMRPELDEFRLGIQKAREAIDNSIGNPKDYQFQPPATGRHTAIADSVQATVKPGKPAGPSTSSAGRDGAKCVKEGSSNVLEETEKQLLGRLYADKVYLEGLVNDDDFVNNPNEEIIKIASDALDYLESRTEFWRQQKPIYARKNERSDLQGKVISARNRKMLHEKAVVRKQREEVELERERNPKAGGGWQPPPNQIDLAKNPLPDNTKPWTPHAHKERGAVPNGPRLPALQAQKVVSSAFYKINRAMEIGDYDGALRMAKSFLAHTNNLSYLVNRDKVTGEIYSIMGTIYFEMGVMSQAVHYHKKDFMVGRDLNLKEAKSRALGNIGRVFVRLCKYPEAIRAFEEKLNYTSDPSIDRAWLLHDIGRCNLELGFPMVAAEYGEKSAAVADALKDKRWALNARVLVGQGYSRIAQLQQAIQAYTTAQQHAKDLSDMAVHQSISKALEDVRARKAKEGSGGRGSIYGSLRPNTPGEDARGERKPSTSQEKPGLVPVPLMDKGGLRPQVEQAGRASTIGRISKVAVV
ncbi:uncharacterized protein BJ171DRAFT_623115 [Polychytrium aggregatum]|uniref:uncharacterized protein n=1 Tax=Polychytrium aggregatum TaxID=110093 RepID=UPI0022FE5CD6|nr:uncharacterized protein BJ171DRAFT_623115 [Polychytrium aggregatum]KAI9203623.1 hypothetical protein BJ171DRAFT_623115 [Polychytrium aggregatum]